VEEMGYLLKIKLKVFGIGEIGGFMEWFYCGINCFLDWFY